MVEIWDFAMHEQLAKRFDIKDPITIMIRERGIVCSYRSPEFFSLLRQRATKWIQNNDVTSLLQANVMANTWVHKKQLSKTCAGLLDDCKQIRENFLVGYIGLFVADWALRWNQEFLDTRGTNLFREQLLEEMSAVRKTDALFDGTAALIDDCLQALAELTNKPLSLLRVLTYEELCNIPKIDELKKMRSDGYAYICGNVIEPPEHFVELEKKGFIIERDTTNATKTTGVSVYSGTVRGNAVVVMNREQLQKVNENSVLIAPMTTPSYLPAMKRALAFVTDEGGMLCHAAIVARELKKPCVVGTTNATTIFRDGDNVEVDATNGIVQKLAP